jgi:hypothetical protein
MIDPAQIPDEVVEAAARARWRCAKPTEWEKETCRLIIAAGLAAWPGMIDAREDFERWGLGGNHLILPLPQQASDD